MEIKTLQTEIATEGYGPAMVRNWDIIRTENPDCLPRHPHYWKLLLRAAKNVREDICEEAVKHLPN